MSPDVMSTRPEAAASTVHDKLRAFLNAQGETTHPFEDVTATNAERVVEAYLAMSVAFPYLQGSASLPTIRQCLAADVDLPAGTEATSAVGAFLVSDEFAIHSKVLKDGNAGLPSILSTKSFHANLLRRDLENIFGRPVLPRFTGVTRDYLQQLYEGLSSLDPVERSAWMVSFEGHADRMIRSLWASLSAATGSDPDSLVYFVAHVGGEDPAEAYHVAMTTRLIDEVVGVDDVGRFLVDVGRSYQVHVAWCAALVKH